MKLKKLKKHKKINNFKNKKKTPKICEPKTKEELSAEKEERKEKRKTFYVDPDQLVKEIKDYYKCGVMTDNIGIMINNIAVKLSFSPNFINYCVDSTSEALTQRGWLKWDQIELTDQIQSYDIENKELVWGPVKDVYFNDYNKLMYSLSANEQTYFLSGNIIDALVTNNHKFVTLENGLTPIEEIKENDHLILQPNIFCEFKNIDVHRCKYEGIIWCPQTEYGTFVCKRNNSIYISGNTFKNEMCGDAIIKMFTALKNKKFDCDRGYSPFSYFTKIAFNSFRNRIKKEQKMRETLASYKEDTYDALLQIGIDVTTLDTHPNNDGVIEQ